MASRSRFFGKGPGGQAKIVDLIFRRMVGGFRHAIRLAGVCLFLLALASSQTAPAAGNSQAGQALSPATSSDSLTFVRKISSAQDVKRPGHPELARALDIIAGPAEATPVIPVLDTPTAVTTDAMHRLYVADPIAHGIHVFDFDQSKYTLLEGHSERLQQPFGLAMSPEGNLYVSDVRLGAILVYDAHGKFQGYLGKRKKESYFEAPLGIAINRTNGRIYVCDAGRDMVIELDRKGHILTHFGKRGGGKGQGEFKSPTQVAIDDNLLFVLDSGNQRIQIMDLHGHFRSEIKLPEVDKRAGLAVDRNGVIYLAQTYLGSIQAYSREGQPLFRTGTNGTENGEFQAPYGLWVDPRDGLYIADSGNHRVQQFRINFQSSK